MSARVIKDRLLDLIFPEMLVCASCGREAAVRELGLCEDCLVGLELFNSAPPIEGIKDFTSVYIYNDVSSRMVKNLKYNNAKYLAKPLADAIELPEEWHIDAVVPVPLHPHRIRQRGYNQSELIAKRLCERTGLEMRKELLRRIVDTGQQTRMTLAGRKKNLKGAFEASENVKGLSILLVDDVRTTGATLRECAMCLKNSGAAEVYAATVAFAKHEKGGSV